MSHMNTAALQARLNEDDCSAFVAIVGRPMWANLSLLNTMIGQKVAIVFQASHKQPVPKSCGVLTKGKINWYFWIPRGSINHTMLWAIIW